MGFSKRDKKEILLNYKRPKKADFFFERIALFFINSDKSDAHQVIPYRTMRDLDMEELFMFMDRTCSKIGQQYLYATLRMIPKNDTNSQNIERIIKYLDDSPQLKESAVVEMSRLNSAGAYFLQSLIYQKHISKPKWFWSLIVLSALSCLSLILAKFLPVLLVVFILVGAGNFIIHYWNKKNVFIYSNSIPQLLILKSVVNKLLQSGVITDNTEQIRAAVAKIDKVSRLTFFLKLEESEEDIFRQVAYYIFELIKATFLVEPLVVFKIIDKLESCRDEIGILFNAVAQIDVAVSIASFREGLPYYTLPKISPNGSQFAMKEVFHPLINNPVANDLDLSDGKSVLVSGSNMSGKTTFIRTVGINTILSQTINTACAKEFIISQLKVHSAIKISDNLLDDTSYYYEEVKAIKKMILEKGEGHQHLFLLDELFKGTNTIERIASGKAVLSYLNDEHNWVIGSTHDLELTEYLTSEYSYYHFAESVDGDLLKFDFKLKTGRSQDTNAIRILEINAFPKEITEEAKALARKIKDGF